MATLSFERGLGFIGDQLELYERVGRAIDLAGKTRIEDGRLAIEDDGIAQRLASIKADCIAIRAMTLADIAETDRTGMPGPKGSMMKLMVTATHKALSEVVGEILGAELPRIRRRPHRASLDLRLSVELGVQHFRRHQRNPARDYRRPRARPAPVAMTSFAPLRLGIAGANPERGWFRDAHFPALKALPGLAIHAVSARTQEIADAARAAFGATTAYADSLALARDPDVDIVAVTVKVPEHRAIVLAALAAGKHVYCEWPLGRDLAEAEEMAAAARAAGIHAAVGLQGANAAAVRHAAQLVREGAIGRPLNLRVVSSTAGWGAAAPPQLCLSPGPAQRRDPGDDCGRPYAGDGRGRCRRIRERQRAQFDLAGSRRQSSAPARLSRAPAPITC